MRVLFFLFLFAGCETPAPKKDLTPGPPPVEGINGVCSGDGCEEMHK